MIKHARMDLFSLGPFHGCINKTLEVCIMRLTETEKFKMIGDLNLKYFMTRWSEIENAIEFVSEMLELEIEYTKQNEPYAINSIYEMESANKRVRDLLDVIEEMRNKQ